MRIKGEPGFILHRRPFSESSLLLDIFSRRYGRITAIAKGARRQKSQYRGMIRPFALTTLGWSGKGEVKTLTQCEWAGPDFGLRGPNLFCGYYLSELLIKFLQRYDPHERLFDQYLKSLVHLGVDGESQSTLRLFEKVLLRETGYGLRLDRDHDTGQPIKPNSSYHYRPGLGAFVNQGNEAGGVVIRGSSLIALREELHFDAMILRELKQLHRVIFQSLLDGRSLVTRQIFSQIYQTEKSPLSAHALN